MAKILMVVGSNRTNSYNRQLADAIVKEIGDRAEVSFLDYRNVPIFNQDEEFPAPESVQEARAAFDAADGIWVVTPQYNDSYPGLVKNLLDWMSRATEQGIMESASTQGAKLTISSAAGNTAGAAVIEKAKELGEFIGMKVMADPVAGIALSGESWQTGNLILSDSDKKAVADQAAAFLDFIAQ